MSSILTWNKIVISISLPTIFRFLPRRLRRWRIEIFFKWIKQNLKIKTFYGQSENAVKSQIWIAICVYLLVCILKKELQISRPMSEILQILSLFLFDKTPIFTLLNDDSSQIKTNHNDEQLVFPGFTLGH